MLTDWRNDNGKMRLWTDGFLTPSTVELDRGRWKAARDEKVIGWFTSLRDAKDAAERSARQALHFELARF